MKKHLLTGLGALMITTAPAFAGGIERAPQSIAILFESGNYVEFGAGRVSPDVSGKDVAGMSTGDVSGGYNFFGLGLKKQLTDNLSAALIVEQPYGADIDYPAFTGTRGSPVLGGTLAHVDSTTYTALLRYTMDNGFGVHGGLRGSQAEGQVALVGAAYGPLSSYRAELDSTWGWGYVVGVSYERPDIAARVSLTYNSEIDHDFDTSETLAGQPLAARKTTTTVTTPRSWNLEGQTGIAPDTLLFGSVRWVKWSEFQVAPRVFSRAPTATDPLGFNQTAGLVELDDTTTWTIGVGRKFTETWSGAASFSYEKAGDDLVSPLAPTNGRKGVTLAAIYTQDKLKVTAGVTYAKLGEAKPETGTPSVARATMRDNDAFGFGVKVGYSF